ncbi:hypothetical protein FKG96_06080 [Olivibacter sp. LS-1]|uniref:hypothetical protein n=1 Tax=unclassified Olivibacter TaxID=2632301 RepID=UPI0011EB4C62|nr:MULTISPECIES: hypothetical protein [unclassified Olivibacter]MDM8177240.1 hypothetical protein [Olivibacter sp. 47]QEL00394.1 hypothetical protein FKG96_06080 [Olivibacter sp. LS-1]
MHQPRKLKAGALLSVVGIATIMALLLGLMLLLLRYNRSETSLLLRKLKLERNLESGTALLLSQVYAEKASEEELIDLFKEETDSISLQHYPWGLYEIAIIKSFEGIDTLKKVFLKGNAIQNDKAYALYLKDDDRPLSISGKSVVRGTAYLPPAGIRKAYIEDKAYEGDTTVYGDIKKSEKKLPALNTALIEQIKLLNYDSLKNRSDSVLSFYTLKDSVNRSFYQKPLILSSEDSISLENLSLKGAVVVVSKRAIYLPSSAQIEHAIFIAPKIKIAKDFKGTLQAFAQDSILVEENVELPYPSALGLIERRTENSVQEFTPEIVIHKDAKIHGVVFSVAATSATDFMNRIRMEPGSEIHGEVYADGMLELKGSVFGSVTCQRFVLQTSSSLYDNFLLDAVINYTKRSRHYLESALLQTAGKGGVVKWLH